MITSKKPKEQKYVDPELILQLIENDNDILKSTKILELINILKKIDKIKEYIQTSEQFITYDEKTQYIKDHVINKKIQDIKDHIINNLSSNEAPIEGLSELDAKTLTSSLASSFDCLTTSSTNSSFCIIDEKDILCVQKIFKSIQIALFFAELMKMTTFSTLKNVMTNNTTNVMNGIIAAFTFFDINNISYLLKYYDVEFKVNEITLLSLSVSSDDYINTTRELLNIIIEENTDLDSIKPKINHELFLAIYFVNFAAVKIFINCVANHNLLPQSQNILNHFLNQDGNNILTYAIIVYNEDNRINNNDYNIVHIIDLLLKLKNSNSLDLLNHKNYHGFCAIDFAFYPKNKFIVKNKIIDHLYKIKDNDNHQYISDITLTVLFKIVLNNDDQTLQYFLKVNNENDQLIYTKLINVICPAKNIHNLSETPNKCKKKENCKQINHSDQPKLLINLLPIDNNSNNTSGNNALQKK